MSPLDFNAFLVSCFDSAGSSCLLSIGVVVIAVAGNLVFVVAGIELDAGDAANSS